MTLVRRGWFRPVYYQLRRLELAAGDALPAIACESAIAQAYEVFPAQTPAPIALGTNTA